MCFRVSTSNLRPVRQHRADLLSISTTLLCHRLDTKRKPCFPRLFIFQATSPATTGAHCRKLSLTNSFDEEGNYSVAHREQGRQLLGILGLLRAHSVQRVVHAAPLERQLPGDHRVQAHPGAPRVDAPRVVPVESWAEQSSRRRYQNMPRKSATEHARAGGETRSTDRQAKLGKQHVHPSREQIPPIGRPVDNRIAPRNIKQRESRAWRQS